MTSMKKSNEERKFKKDGMFSWSKYCQEIKYEAWEVSMTLAIRG